MPITLSDFKTRVEDIVGALSPTDNTALTDWLTASAREIIDILPKEKLIRNASNHNPDTSSATNLTYDLKENKLLGITRDGYECKEVGYGMANQVTVSSGSMFEPSKTSPVYYIKGGVATVKPDPTATEKLSVTVMPYPTVAHGFKGIPNFPNEAEDLVVVKTSMRCLQRMMSDMMTSLPADVSSPSLDTMSETLPTYVAPSPFSAPSSLAAPNIDFSGVPSSPSYVAPSLSLTSAPSISGLSITSSAPSSPSISSQSVSFSATAPSYSAPSKTFDIEQLETFLETEEDVELAQGQLGRLSHEIQEHRADIENELNEFNKENAEYQAELKKAIQNSELSSRDDAQLIQKYSAQVQEYQASVNKEVQEYQSNLEKDIKLFEIKRQTELQEYQANIKNNMTTFESSFKVYQQEIQKAIQTYQHETGYDVSKYQADLQTESERFKSDLSKNLETFNSGIKKYTAEYQRVSQNNQSIIAKYSGDVQSFGAKIQKQVTKYGWYEQQFAKLADEYKSGLQVLIGMDRSKQAPERGKR